MKPANKRNMFYIKATLFIFIFIMTSLSSQADGKYTRGIGKYPGKASEYKGPKLVKTSTYRNLALLKAATASSSIDYNLTAQLATDGIITRNNPPMLKVTIGNFGANGSVSAEQPSLRDKEKTIDGNIHSQNILQGENAYIQYDWTAMSVHPDTLHLLSEVVYYPDRAKSGYTIKVLGSGDGKRWKVLGEEKGDSLPGKATRQAVSSDPNKQEAAIRLPLRLVNTDIPLSKKAIGKGVSHIRIEFHMNGCAYWRLYEIAKYGGWMPSSQFGSAWVADSNTDASPWLCVDLGADADIDKVKAFWIHQPQDCEIQTSSDGKSWVTIATGKLGYIEHKSRLHPTCYTCNGRGRYVRITMRNPDASGLFALSEFEVWGKGGLEPVTSTTDEGITNWQLCREGDNQWIPATVPGTVLTSFMNIGAVPDNTIANNMRQISESFFNSNFIYRADIKVKTIDHSRHTYLCFDGINWKAEVWLNGSHLGNIDGAFIRGKFDVTQLLKEGDNELKVKVLKNEHIGAVKVKNMTSTDLNGGVLGADNPTFHASIGWDWITTVPGREIGIWNDVYLSTDCGVSVADPLVTTTLSNDHKLATMTPSVFVKNYSGEQKTVTVKGWIGDIHFSKEVSLNPSEEKDVAFSPEEFTQLKNQKMHLWWPNGYGEPYLYDAGFCIEGDEASGVNYKAGIREMTYETLDTQTKLYINGKRLDPLGGNWGFSETNLNYRAREYDAAVKYHKEMNFNMIRNWVGQVGDEEFYEACDRYGIMVWQDFWLANPWDGPDPYDNSLFLSNSSDFIKKIRRHPSIGIYVGRNEGYPPEPLDKGLRAQLKQLHPQLGYIPSSADDGVSGHGPYNMMPTKFYFEHQTKKLHSERGMSNVPTFESLRRMLSPQDLWPISEAWGQHDFTMQGAQRGEAFCNIMEQHFGKPQSAEQFTKWSQWLNYDGYRAMYESSQQYRLGLLIWMSHSCWPNMVWCTYDYYFEPTGAYFGAKKACEPLHVQLNASTGHVEVVNIATGKHPTLKVTAQTLDMNGKLRSEQTDTVSIEDDQTVESIKMAKPDEDVFYVRLRLTEGDSLISENFYVQGKEEEKLTALMQLPKVDLEKEEHFSVNGNEHTGTVTISNNSNTPALLIRLNLKASDGEQILPVIYSDNYFALMPGEKKTVHITYHDEDGRGLKPTVEVSAFNQ